MNFRHHGHRFGGQAGGSKVARDPVFKVTSFADVEHLALSVEHSIHAGLTRKALY